MFGFFVGVASKTPNSITKFNKKYQQKTIHT